MSTPQNTFVRSEFERIEVAIHPNTAIDQGDLVYLDATNRALPMSAAPNLAFIGVAEDTNPVASLGDKLSQITVIRRGTFRFQTTAGETYAPFTAVYGTNDPQTVTTVSTGRTRVGYVSPNQAGRTDVFPLTGAAGTTVDVIVVPTHPSETA